MSRRPPASKARCTSSTSSGVVDSSASRGEYLASRPDLCARWTASATPKVRVRTRLTAAFHSQASVRGSWPDAVASDENSRVCSATRETLAQPMAKQQSREPVLGRVFVVPSGRPLLVVHALAITPERHSGLVPERAKPRSISAVAIASIERLPAWLCRGILRVVRGRAFPRSGRARWRRCGSTRI
jgi:hypothetical protein